LDVEHNLNTGVGLAEGGTFKPISKIDKGGNSPMREKVDVIISNGAVITMDEKRRIFNGGSVVIDGDRILDVDKAHRIEGRYKAEETIDAEGCAVMPGLINCHIHLPQMLMRGVQDDAEVMDELMKYIWPIQGCYDEEDGKISSLLAFLEMLKSGTTSFISTGLHPRYGIDGILRELEKSGLRGAVSKYIMEKRAYADEEMAIHEGLHEVKESSMREALRLIKEWNGKADGKIRIWLSPRSVGACSVETLREISEIAKKYQVGITMHWAEAENNLQYTRKVFNMGMAKFAEFVGLLAPNVTMAHGIWFEHEEIYLLARSGVNICHCPITNSKLAMGVAKIPEMLRAGVNVCLGTDGAPVNNTCDLFQEMKFAVLLHRINSLNPVYPRAEEALEMATINGARALGLEKEVGSLEAGKKADVIVVNLKNHHAMPVHDPASAVVWATSGNDVKTVLIDGKLVVENRKVLTLEEEEILAKAQGKAEKILQKAKVEVKRKWPLI
jgi:cytosine/adenosine deaminase-related metal-dependent hydrolase